MTYKEFTNEWARLTSDVQAQIYVDMCKQQCGECESIWNEFTEDFFRKYFGSYMEAIKAWENGFAYESDDYIRVNSNGNIETASFIDVADEATDQHLHEIYKHPELWETRIEERETEYSILGRIFKF